MNKQLSVVLILAVVIVSVSAGCGTTAGIETTSPPSQTTLNTTASTSVAATGNTSPVTSGTAPTETTIPSAFTTTPVTTVFSLPPLVPTDPAVYPVIVGGVTTVILADGHFSPPIIKIPVGTTVEWQATDHLSDHAIYGDDGKFWGGVIAWIPLDRTFTTPGTFAYHDVESMGGNGIVIVF